MTNYEKNFNDIKKTFSKANAKKLNGDWAFQFNIIGEGAGAFYTEYKNGDLTIAPFDYNNNNAEFWASGEIYNKIANGRLSYDQAIADGVLTVSGNTTLARDQVEKLFGCACNTSNQCAQSSQTHGRGKNRVRDDQDFDYGGIHDINRHYGASVESAFSPITSSNISDYEQ